MNIFELLRSDHRALAALLERIEKTTQRAHKSRASLLERARADFGVHASAEERVLYAELRQKDPTHDLILEADEEHALARRLFDELEGVDVADERWLAKFKLLKEAIQHHVKEEEGEMFPKARRLIDAARARALAERMREAKQQELQALDGREGRRRGRSATTAELSKRTRAPMMMKPMKR